jgi:putative oxidoreductase
MDKLRKLAIPVGRILISAIFIYDATLLVRYPDDNMAFMAEFGVPGFLLWPTAVFQFVGGIMLVAGVLARPVAFAFAVFCLLTALIFHRNFSDPAEAIQFGKDVALAGGFLFLTALGGGPWSLDDWRGR